MKSKLYHIIKSAIVDNAMVRAAEVSVVSKSYQSALAGIGAVNPQLRSQHSGICIFTDANRWTYLVTFEKCATKEIAA